MSYRYTAIPVLFLLFSVVALGGCTSVRLSDTHNTTVAVQSYTSWTETQKSYGQQAQAAITQIGGHITEYNSEITKGSPDIGTLRGDVASDHQLLRQWADQEAGLDAATETFASATSSLDYHSADSKEAVGTMAQEMRIYAVDMKNTQQHLVEYANFMDAYLTPDDPDYWNDAQRISAMNANADAVKSIADGDSALGAISSAAKKLENSQ